MTPKPAAEESPNRVRRLVIESPRLGAVHVTLKGGVPVRAAWTAHRGATNFLSAHWSPAEFAALMDELGLDNERRP
jgi:hypothetical protein